MRRYFNLLDCALLVSSYLNVLLFVHTCNYFFLFNSGNMVLFM